MQTKSDKSSLEIKMKKILILCLLFASSVLYAQTGSNMTKTGTTAAQFLKIGIGARAIGMGGAFTAFANDATAQYWNPAGIARLTSGEATFGNISWIADINVKYVAVSYDLSGFGTVGLNITSLGMDDIPVTSADYPEGTGEKYNSGDISIGLAYARNLTEAFSIGFVAKYVHEYLWHMKSSAFAFDIGTLFTAPFLNGIRLGASISNYGTKMKLDGRDSYIIYRTGSSGNNVVNAEYQLSEYDLPLLFRVGLSSDIYKTNDWKVTASVDAVHPNDNTEYLNSGFELGWEDLLFLRAGYKSIFEKNTEQGLTAGAGFNYRISSGLAVILDYAYLDFGRLNAVHMISLSARF
jgi:opacity protein-like surface antigen